MVETSPCCSDPFLSLWHSLKRVWELAVSIPLATNEVPPDLEETLVPKTDVVVVTVWVEVEIARGDLTLLVAVAVAEVRVEALIKPLATNELSLNVPLPEVVLFTLD